MSFLATSVDVEHVFSKGRLILSYIHNYLSVDSTWAILCLRAWIRLDLISKEDIQMAAKLPDVKKGEEEAEDSVCRSGPVWFFDPKMGNGQPQLVA